jgi:glycosyltransferase involved in cell wall biosynthesis
MKKKIALITPSLAKGGIEKVVVVSAAELEKYYDVTVIVMDTFRTDYPYEGRIIDLGLSWEDRRIIPRLMNFAKAVSRLRKIKKEEQFDLVIGHGELASFPNILSGGKRNLVVVHENRFAAKKDLQGMVVNKLLRLLFTAKNVLRIVTVSEGIRQSFLERFGIAEEKIVTIHNPYDIDTLKSLSAEHLEPRYETLFTHPVLVAAGRLIPAKGQWYLLRVFAALKQKDPHMKLVILGEAASRSDLGEKLIVLSRALGLKTYSVWEEERFDASYDVYFLGFHQNPFKYMAASRLFVMTSVWEGFGNTIVEAMACGTPVISSDCPSGPGEIIAPRLKQKGLTADNPVEEYGILMPPFENRFVEADEPLNETEKLWVEQLYSLLHDEERLEHLSRKGLQRAEAFRTKTIMQEWQRVIGYTLMR